MSENVNEKARRDKKLLEKARHDLALADGYIRLAIDRLFDQYRARANELIRLADELEKHIRALWEAENEVCASK